MRKFLFLLALGGVVWVFPPTLVEADTWHSGTPMPIPGLGIGGVIDGKLYVVGVSGVVEAYDPATDTWAFKAPIPSQKHLSGSAVANGKLYVIGGGHGIASFPYWLTSRLVQEYDPVTDTWTTKAAMPTSRSGLAAAEIDGKVLAIGGRPTGGRVEEYDPAADTWTAKTSMPTERRWLAASVVNGMLYAVGGWEGNFSSVLERYDPATDTWTSLTPLPTPAAQMDAGVIRGKLYVAGGFSDALVIYDPSTDSWSSGPPMPTPRYDHVVGIIDGKLYVAGGTHPDGLSGFVTALDVYDPTTPPDELLADLIDLTATLDLPYGIENSLLVKLNAAALILGDLQANNDHAAANMLGAFIQQVQAQYGKKIAASDADALIEAADQIIELLSEDLTIRRPGFRRRAFSPGRRLGLSPQEPE